MFMLVGEVPTLIEKVLSFNVFNAALMLASRLHSVIFL